MWHKIELMVEEEKKKEEEWTNGWRRKKEGGRMVGSNLPTEISIKTNKLTFISKKKINYCSIKAKPNSRPSSMLDFIAVLTCHTCSQW